MKGTLELIYLDVCGPITFKYLSGYDIMLHLLITIQEIHGYIS